MYVVSTAPEPGQDYWTIGVLPVIEKRGFFGRHRAKVDLRHPIARLVRNNKEDAHSVHAEVRHIVANLREAEWFDAFPSPKPPEGYSAGARARLSAMGVDPDS
jgi:hypothetical protein